MSTADNDFRPTASWDRLRLRSGLLRRLRDFFEQHGFLEVETPLLSADTVIDRHLDPIPVTLFDDSRFPTEGRRLWLQTSPEFGMKRLLAAGGESIFQVTRAFRAGEKGNLHNPEFTIVEWYRRGDTMQDGIELLSDLCCTLLNTKAAERLSYAEAFSRYVDIDPHDCSAVDLRKKAASLSIDLPDALVNDRDAWLHRLLVERVEPNLGQDGPAIVYDYPVSQAGLSRTRNDNPPVAERFELYFRGIELANGYHELIDASDFRDRNREANAARATDGKDVLPEESHLLAAMDQGLPACAGVALGFDRLVMLAAGATSVSEVMTFPIDRA